VAEDRRACVEHFRRCRVENDAVETELRLTSRTGEVLPVLLSSQTARSDGGVHFRTAIIDLRDRLRVEHERLASQLEVERLKSEEQLAHREKEAKDRWLAVVSHELRTPLTPVLFAISNLTRVTALPGEARRLVDVIRRNSEAELHLIDDLLDMNRISRGKLALNVAHVDLHDLIVSVIESWAPHAQAKGLQIETDLEAADHSIEADAARLRQILLILTTNAVKFTPDGGRIVIGSRNPSTESISIFVTDTGIGFDAGSDERLFEPFEQMGQREAGLSGMGLGLTIARGIVLAHGGRLIAHSPGPGKGATFRVELPLHPKAPLPSEAPSGDR
jgi:signal transduction histidine kinase